MYTLTGRAALCGSGTYLTVILVRAVWLIGWPGRNGHDSIFDRPLRGALTVTCLPIPPGASLVPSSVA